MSQKFLKFENLKFVIILFIEQFKTEFAKVQKSSDFQKVQNLNNEKNLNVQNLKKQNSECSDSENSEQFRFFWIVCKRQVCNFFCAVFLLFFDDFDEFFDDFNEFWRRF